jgi:hypothetical protein
LKIVYTSGTPEAYWISPKGKVLVVPITHIHLIIKYPNLFGLTLDGIKKEYRKHREPLFFEGYARESIMYRLLKRDWIRLRFDRHDFWTIQTKTLNHETISRIEKWVRDTLRKKHLKLSTGVKIINEHSETLKDYDKYMVVKDISNGCLRKFRNTQCRRESISSS